MATTTEAAWTAFADKMRAEDAIPPLASWNELLTTAANSGELDKALWILGTMKATGTRPTAVTYEILLAGCAAAGNRTVAFSLIEQMWDDKVLLGPASLLAYVTAMTDEADVVHVATGNGTRRKGPSSSGAGGTSTGSARRVSPATSQAGRVRLPWKVARVSGRMRWEGEGGREDERGRRRRDEEIASPPALRALAPASGSPTRRRATHNSDHRRGALVPIPPWWPPRLRKHQ